MLAKFWALWDQDPVQDMWSAEQFKIHAIAFWLKSCSVVGQCRSHTCALLTMSRRACCCDLDDAAAARIFEQHIPAASLEFNKLFAYTHMNMKGSPKWDQLEQHKYLLADLLVASGGRRLRQKVLQRQVDDYLKSHGRGLQLNADQLATVVYRLRVMIVQLFQKSAQAPPKRYQHLQMLLDLVRKGGDDCSEPSSNDAAEVEVAPAPKRSLELVAVSSDDENGPKMQTDDDALAKLEELFGVAVLPPAGSCGGGNRVGADSSSLTAGDWKLSQNFSSKEIDDLIGDHDANSGPTSKEYRSRFSRQRVMKRPAAERKESVDMDANDAEFARPSVMKRPAAKVARTERKESVDADAIIPMDADDAFLPRWISSTVESLSGAIPRATLRNRLHSRAYHFQLKSAKAGGYADPKALAREAGKRATALYDMHFPVVE